VERRTYQSNPVFQRRDLRTTFSASVDVYRTLINRTNELFKETLKLNKRQELASDVCPACFGPGPTPLQQTTPEEQSTHSVSQEAVNLSTSGVQSISEVNIPQQQNTSPLVICLDGNFQQRHHFAASKNYLELLTPTNFIQPSAINEMDRTIKNQEQAHHVRGTVCSHLILSYFDQLPCFNSSFVI
jgi:hypothetical protein